MHSSAVGEQLLTNHAAELRDSSLKSRDSYDNTNTISGAHAFFSGSLWTAFLLMKQVSNWILTARPSPAEACRLASPEVDPVHGGVAAPRD